MCLSIRYFLSEGLQGERRPLNKHSRRDGERDEHEVASVAKLEWSFIKIPRCGICIAKSSSCLSRKKIVDGAGAGLEFFYNVLIVKEFIVIDFIYTNKYTNC